MHRRRALTLLPAVALVVAACSGGGTSSSSAPSGRSTGLKIVEVTLLDTLRTDPAGITVQAGQALHFVVTNGGAINHEFYLGDAAAQMAHGQDMMGQTGMMHDEPNGMGLMPGTMKTIDHTFTTPGTYEAGCHVDDHYAAGMKMVITVEP